MVGLGSTVSVGSKICGDADGSTGSGEAVTITVVTAVVSVNSGDSETIADDKGPTNSSDVGLGSTDSSTSGDSETIGDSEGSTVAEVSEILGGAVSGMFDFDGDCDIMASERGDDEGSGSGSVLGESIWGDSEGTIDISGNSGDSVGDNVSTVEADISGEGNSGDEDISKGEGVTSGVIVGSIVSSGI